MNKFKLSSVLAFGLVAPAALANLKIVTTTADLASIAASIGGNKAKVSSLITGARDPHRIEAKPSYMSRVAGADMFIAIGLELEIGYEQSILQGSSNRRVAIGAPGHVYASDFAYTLEKPTGKVTRAMGDIHPYGNPHVWLDPYNGRMMAKGIENKMSALDPSNASYYQSNLEQFLKRLDSAMFGSSAVARYGGQQLWEWSTAGNLRSKVSASELGGWAEQMAPFAGKPVITYHKSWSYFAYRFGLKVVDELEPKPGLDPTPGHLAEVVREGTLQGVKTLLQEPFFSRRHADFVARRIGAVVAVAPQSVGQDPGAKDYISLFDTIVAKVRSTVR
ncbi:MAG: zinc ABC transporter substrate-binding protein [Chlorobia bacterium]|nr:zinc ABC transporter substrate-binding protein [Fimbriimonadaceae bacterium]